MTRRQGPAPAQEAGPHPNLEEVVAAAKPLGLFARQCTGGQPPTGGELLRRLARHVLEATDPADARERLQVAAETATPLVNGRRLDRTAAVTVLSVAAQAAGIGQAEAFGVIWRALWGAP